MVKNMIYSTFSQLNALFYSILIGIIIYLIIFIFKIIFLYNFANIIFKNIQLFFYTLFCGFGLIYLINHFNYGEYNVVLIISFLGLIFYSDKMLKNSLDFLSKKVYHIYSRLTKWEKNYIAKRLTSIED